MSALLCHSSVLAQVVPVFADAVAAFSPVGKPNREAGPVAEAIPLHEQTLAACERVLGPDHTYTPSSRNNLAAYRAARRTEAVHAAPTCGERALMTRSDRKAGSGLRPPRPDHPPADLSQERIQRRPVLGGLISEYQRVA
jgi:hypothetical protein